MLHRAFIGLAFLSGTVSAQELAAKNKPDVLLVTIDTLRRDHVGCYGRRPSPTPNLDTLCANSIRYDDAVSASTITNTSHASILTGLYPSRHGVTDFGVGLDPSHVTLAEQLKKNGYKTAAFIGAVILDSASLAPGMGRGFNYFDSFPAKAPSAARWERVERRAAMVVDHANAWLAKTVGSRFAWIHLYDPHDPYEPPEPFATRYAQDPYDGEIAYADDALGRVFSALKKAGRYDNTLIVVMSDHGEGLGEHGENTHGIFLYDTTLRIPLLMKLPGKSKGQTVSSQVSSVDVMPTILAVLNIPGPTVDGASLLPLRSKPEGRVVFAETDYPLRFGWAPLKAVRKDGKKYIEAPRPEVYDLRNDPSEKDNRYEPWDEGSQGLRATLADFRKAAPTMTTTATAPVDPKTVEELKALGYLGTNPGETSVPEPSMLPDPKDKIEVQNLIHSGMMHQDNGEVDRATTAFAKATDQDPGSFAAWNALGEIQFKAKEYKAAAKSLSHAYSLQPQNPSTALLLGQTLEKTGDFQTAIRVLESALKDSPGQYDARVSIGRAYAAAGQTARAQDQFEAAILVDSKRPAAHLELAKSLLSQDRKTEARQHLERAAAADPGNQEIKDLLLKVK